MRERISGEINRKIKEGGLGGPGVFKNWEVNSTEGSHTLRAGHVKAETRWNKNKLKKCFTLIPK